MDITIRAIPSYDMVMPLKMAELIRDLGLKHYDSACRAACTPGPDGFVHGWVNRLTPFDEPLDPNTYVTATWRQLDLTLKILEPYGLNHYPLTMEQTVMLHAFVHDVRRAMNTSPMWFPEFVKGGV